MRILGLKQQYSVKVFACKRQLRCRKRRKWTCDLFFSRLGLCPNLEKNKSHVQKTSFAAEGGVISTQIFNGVLYKVFALIAKQCVRVAFEVKHFYYYFFKIRNATRRFIWRLSSVSFDEMGWLEPKPLACSRLGSTLPLRIIYSMTCVARRRLSVRL
jgi:hypothetical protein